MDLRSLHNAHKLTLFSLDSLSCAAIVDLLARFVVVVVIVLTIWDTPASIDLALHWAYMHAPVCAIADAVVNLGRFRSINTT